MKHNKILCLATAVIMTVSCASCGKPKTDEASSDGVKTVTIWTGESHSKDFVTEQVNEFNKTLGKEKGIKIDYVVKPDMGQVLDMALVSDQAPDMFCGGNFEQLVTNDNIVALEDLPGGEDYAKSYDQKYLMDNVQKYNGKTYTVPYAATTDALVYNKDLFEQAGIVDENGKAKAPETLDELREDAKKLTDPSKQQYGIVFPAKWGGWFGSDINEVASACTGCINGYNPKTGKYDFTAHGDIMKVYMGIKEDGSYLPGAEGIDNDPARAKFAAGTIGMKFAGSFDYAVFTEQFPAKCNWGVAPLPVLDKNERYKAFADRSGYLFINKKSVDKVGGDKLMEVYKFMTGKDMLAKAYKAGKTIPYDYSIVKDVELPDNMENWKAFAELCDTSFTSSKQAKSDTSGKTNIVEQWTEQIWPGKVSVDQIDAAVKNCADICNEGIDTYKAAHPEYDVTKDIDANYDQKIK